MASRQRKMEYLYEKPSKTRQWQERSERPISNKVMTEAEMEYFRQLLADSYRCSPADIIYEFEKILDENDEDRDDCIWIKYKIKCVWQNKPTLREIFIAKLTIPDEIKIKAEQIRNNARKQFRALPAPEQAKPRLKRPVLA